jgi:hypothetical protein
LVQKLCARPLKVFFTWETSIPLLQGRCTHAKPRFYTAFWMWTRLYLLSQKLQCLTHEEVGKPLANDDKGSDITNLFDWRMCFLLTYWIEKHTFNCIHMKQLHVNDAVSSATMYNRSVAIFLQYKSRFQCIKYNRHHMCATYKIIFSSWPHSAILSKISYGEYTCVHT